MAKSIMLQGTSSHVGKSILTTALCRILYQDGYRVVPFKAQNMALNSYVTKTGEEMGRAQVAQAEAACLDPIIEMNPVLLKPTGNSSSQVVLMGKPIGNMSAKEYHQGYSLKALGIVKECLDKLMTQFDAVVIEGAGSPAEVNLKANDIVNMRVAKMISAPVLLVADIDRGGALASIVGTLELLEPDERDLIKGLIINKFRGDLTLLAPALDFLEQKTGKPVLGVIPHIEDIGIDDEDSVSLDDKCIVSQRDIEIAVLRMPKISNFTDFDALAGESDVTVRFVRKGELIGQPDLVILPGSKNTTEDLLYLRENGYEQELLDLAALGTPIIGICGGYQMLGKEIRDPFHTESEREQISGLGLIDIITTFEAVKVTHQVTAFSQKHTFLNLNINANNLTGYEIHMGRTDFLSPVNHAFTIKNRSGSQVCVQDGLVSHDGLIMGTYIHGIFDNNEYRRALINALRIRKGLVPMSTFSDVQARKQKSYDDLAATVRNNLNMKLLYQIIGV
ncbi:Cobyric acid synthase [bioreactor metagenome]|uniref:Cobyric acid synthase n=1 Tax=bioreactor metagenome TaxID=1076179 RepID=A0A644T0K7_9ZZZZ|nr:cobyric acid synthase [Negativicutes bacterium]